MTALVTLEQAKAHLRVDDPFEDNDLTLKIEAASGLVLNHMKGRTIFDPERNPGGSVVLDSSGAVVYTTAVRAEIRYAVLLLVGYMFRARDNDKDQEFTGSSLPRPIIAILNPLRDPALA